jgi:GTPase SAR1 family protein
MEEESQKSDKQIISATASKKIKINNDFPSINPDRIEFKGRLTINIVIIGKKKCGKSALIKSYLQKSFENEKEDTTLDILGKKILVMGHEVSLVICEVSQDKADSELSKDIISIAHIVFICFSSEDDIEKLNEDLIEGSISLIETIKNDVPIFIVGCKFDLIKEENIHTLKIISNNELTPNGKSIKEYINNKRESLKHNFCGYYITSSILSLNIQELFNDAIKTVALPIVLKYQKDANDNNIGGELLEEKIVHQKKKKGDISGIINRKTIEVDENGCIIF